MNDAITVNETKQPKGLKVFCLSIFFERYGFYLVQGLLVLYLVKYFHANDHMAYNILGSFIALCYIMPLLGGFIADKYWGLRKSIYIGAVIECLGLLLLIVPGMLALVMGLSAIAMGMGLLKPCASSLLGFLYKKDDPRQDAGYTIFYVVFNGGIILATFLSGFLVRYFGWKFAFFTGVVALVITFFIFYFGFIKYKLKDLGPNITSTFTGNITSLALIIISVVLGFVILKYEILALIVFIGVSISVIGIFIYCIIKSEKAYKSKLVAFFILLVVSTVYWALYMQMFLSITLFIDSIVNKTFLGITIPTPAFASIESFGVIVFGYPVARLWIFLSKTKFNPSLPMKFCFGMILLCASFGALSLGTHFIGPNGLVCAVWIVIAYLVMAIGELALSPIGLSMVNVLVPEEFNGMMMGIFLLTIGLGGKIAGLLAGIATVPENLTSDPKAILDTYSYAFNVYLLITVVCTVIALLFIPYIKKKMV
jgi:proton-dependent oligopeptide transporter, POT family